MQLENLEILEGRTIYLISAVPQSLGRKGWGGERGERKEGEAGETYD
jgi:hypothetical protein